MVGALVVSQSSYNLWQTLLAWVVMGSMVIAGFTKLNKTIVKKDDVASKEDIAALRAEMVENKESNSKENTIIIAKVEALRDDVTRSEQGLKDDMSHERERLDRHIEGSARKVTRNPMDGQDE